jgi:hypothetical protein
MSAGLLPRHEPSLGGSRPSPSWTTSPSTSKARRWPRTFARWRSRGRAAGGRRPSPRHPQAPMIVRLWHGWTTAGNADAYERLLRGRSSAGSRGGRLPATGHQLLRRQTGGGEFVTALRLLDAVQAFAGADCEVAVVPPSARELSAASMPLGALRLRTPVHPRSRSSGGVEPRSVGPDRPAASGPPRRPDGSGRSLACSTWRSSSSCVNGGESARADRSDRAAPARRPGTRTCTAGEAAASGRCESELHPIHPGMTTSSMMRCTYQYARSSVHGLLSAGRFERDSPLR